MVHIRLDTAGGDNIDRDLLIAKVDGHAAGKRLDGPLGTGVDGVLGDALGLARDGAHEDEAAADLEVLVGLAGDEELAARVGVEDAVELLLGDVLDVAEGDDTAVGAYDVQLPKRLDRFLEQLDNLGYDAHVGTDGHGVGPAFLDLLHHLLGGVFAIRVVDDYLGAATTQLQRHLSADTTT